jgi:LptA/(LptD N-terminal domain) LPS transport protein
MKDRGTQVMRARATRHWWELAAGMAIVVTSAVCALDATAQKNPGPPNALQGFSQNRDEPVKIRAASLELREKDKMATFTGDVYVLQGDTEMRLQGAGRVLRDGNKYPHGERSRWGAGRRPAGPPYRGQRQRGCGSKGSECDRGRRHLQHAREHRGPRRQRRRNARIECLAWPAAGG